MAGLAGGLTASRHDPFFDIGPAQSISDIGGSDGFEMQQSGCYGDSRHTAFERYWKGSKARNLNAIEVAGQLVHPFPRRVSIGACGGLLKPGTHVGDRLESI
jgi:hypothetical protein